MTEAYGPYRQMGTLAERMAAHYQRDANLELGPHLAHYMDEVEVNISAHSFDHVGFMRKIDERLMSALEATSDARRMHFLNAVKLALHERIESHSAIAPVAG